MGDPGESESQTVGENAGEVIRETDRQTQRAVSEKFRLYRYFFFMCATDSEFIPSRGIVLESAAAVRLPKVPGSFWNSKPL